MKIFKTKRFNKWANKNRLDDRALCKAIDEMEAGLVDASLGAHLFKQRVAVSGRGKRGGLRTIIAYRATVTAFYLYGFAKDKKANIESEELDMLRVLAAELLAQENIRLQELVATGELIEVIYNE